MKYLRKSKSKSVSLKSNSSAGVAGGGLPLSSDTGGDIVLEPENIAGPPAGSTNDGVYLVTENQLVVQSAPTVGNRAPLAFVTNAPSEKDNVIYSMTFTGTATSAVNMLFVQEVLGQTPEQTLQSFLDASGPVAGGSVLIGSCTATVTIATQQSPVFLAGNPAPQSLQNGDVLRFDFNKLTGVVNLFRNNVLESTVTATGFDPSRGFYAGFLTQANAEMPAGDTYVFDFSEL